MSKYHEQALKFLDDTNTTLEVVEAVPQTAPLWHKKGEKHGIKYSVTLKNKNHTYTFDFWNSIGKAEILEYAQYCKSCGNTNNQQGDKVFDFLKKKGIGVGMLRIQTARLVETVKEAIKPNAYDILACLSPLYEDSFEDFCSSFGLDTDSITAEKTYKACIEQDRNLRKLWNMDQLEALQEIN